MTHKFPKDWKDKIERSGKLFEQVVARKLQESGFGWVVPNHAFSDVETGESRELDAFGITAKSIDYRRKQWHFIFPILLVAVKDVPIVCFTRKEVNNRFTCGDPHYSGMPKHIYQSGQKVALSDYLKMDRFHHFFKYTRISSQIWTPFQQGKEQKGDYFIRGLVIPLLKAVEAEKREHLKDWYFDPESEPVNLQFYYPIIVVRDLWECDLTGKKPKYRKVSNLGFLSHYSSEKISGDFQIDVCDLEGLSKTLRQIDSESDRIAKTIKAKVKVFENSALEDAKRLLEVKK